MKCVAQLAAWISDSRCFIVFTGAGISTESGIPDFRSPGGVWAKYQPVYFADFMRSEDSRHEYWRQKCEAHREFATSSPNVGHQTLATWETTGQLNGIVTQNIDGLHQIAGNERVLEIHGTAREAECMTCHDRQPIDSLVEEFVQTDVPPRCSCGGPLKHATISFGQSLDSTTLERSQAWMEEADLVFALGSSLVVHPAAGLPEYAHATGAKLVIINRDPTPVDSKADLVLNASLGETLSAIDEAMRS